MCVVLREADEGGELCDFLAFKQAFELLRQSAGQSAKADSRGLHLEDYINSKHAEFVKGMRNGSARNLHPMLIAAVERPLIAIALKEMNGNQIQAAQLLGMNRNTLRKKITHLRIPVKRSKVPKVKPT